MYKFTDYTPEVGENEVDFCRRLEEFGHEEMFIRKTLCYHFERENMEGLGAFFNQFEQARLRHISMLKELEPNRNHYSMVKKVAKNLGLSDELAELWVNRFDEVGNLSFLR